MAENKHNSIMDRLDGKTLSRRWFLGYSAGAIGGAIGLALLSSRAGGLFRRQSGGGGHWYEVVQDMKNANSWHVNLYSGPTPGDLSKGRLLEHRLAQNTSISEIKKRLGYPARIQYVSGQHEQTF